MCDVVICTNRPELIKKQFKHVSFLVPYKNFIVVDSSEKLNKKFYDGLPIKLIHTSLARLGFIRQVGLLNCSSELVFFVDDDITLEPDCFKHLHSTLTNAPKSVLAVNGKVVYGINSDSVLHKLFKCGRTNERRGHSAGFVLMRREPVLAIGGYNKNVHWAEDAELCQRMEKNGFEWIRCWDAVCYHEATFKDMVVRSWKNGKGLKIWWKNGASLRGLFARFFVKTFIMPVYYAFKAKEPRIIVYYFVMNLAMLLGFGKGVKNG
jgi:glycosyltransferase involved in cell wall biosynthesis